MFFKTLFSHQVKFWLIRNNFAQFVQFSFFFSHFQSIKWPKKFCSIMIINSLFSYKKNKKQTIFALQTTYRLPQSNNCTGHYTTSRVFLIHTDHFNINARKFSQLRIKCFHFLQYSTSRVFSSIFVSMVLYELKQIFPLLQHFSIFFLTFP